MDDREKIKKMLGPALAGAVVIVLIALVMLIGQSGEPEKDKGDSGSASKKAGQQPAPIPTQLRDGTAPGAEDPGLKDIGAGLKIRDLQVGEGKEAPEGANVSMHYTGWLMDGKAFDSSLKSGEPLTGPLSRLIPGWQKGVPGMKVGGVRKLVIPPALAYGENGSGPIPPNSTLVFEVELVDVH
jgi:FKBP-type peptidyl-prolyl cis-trans isomerase